MGFFLQKLEEVSYNNLKLRISNCKVASLMLFGSFELEMCHCFPPSLVGEFAQLAS